MEALEGGRAGVWALATLSVTADEGLGPLEQYDSLTSLPHSFLHSGLKTRLCCSWAQTKLDHLRAL